MLSDLWRDPSHHPSSASTAAVMSPVTVGVEDGPESGEVATAGDHDKGRGTSDTMRVIRTLLSPCVKHTRYERG
jgi:hypothetical protein